MFAQSHLQSIRAQEAAEAQPAVQKHGATEGCFYGESCFGSMRSGVLFTLSARFFGAYLMSSFKIMTVRYSSRLNGFDTTALDAFLRDKELLKVSHFLYPCAGGRGSRPAF